MESWKLWNAFELSLWDAEPDFHGHSNDGSFEIVILLPLPLCLFLTHQKGTLGAQKIQLLKQSKQTSDPVLYLVRQARLPNLKWTFTPSHTLCWVITEEDSVLVKLNCSVVIKPFIAAPSSPFHSYYQLQSLFPFPSSTICICPSKWCCVSPAVFSVSCKVTTFQCLPVETTWF